MGGGKYSGIEKLKKESVSKRLERIEYERNKDRFRLNAVDTLRLRKKWESVGAPCLTSNKAFRVKKNPDLIAEFFINRYVLIDLETARTREWLYRLDFFGPLMLHVDLLKSGQFKWNTHRIYLHEMVPPEQWWRYFDWYKKNGATNLFGPHFERLCVFGQPEAPKDEVFSDLQLKIPFGTRIIRI